MGVGLKRNLLSGLMLTLFLLCILISGYKLKPVRSTWTGTVYIRADGSIDPQDAPITTYDNITYTLTDNITSSEHGIVVERDNILIDGAGYTIRGSSATGWAGIYLNSRANVTIKNVKITMFYLGIYIYMSSNINASGNYIIDNNQGISIDSSNSNSISLNSITNNNWGISLGASSDNDISRNMITNNTIGIYITWYENHNNKFWHNNLIDNSQQCYNQYGYSTSVWDDDYPSGGNYWSDYTGVDLYNGPYQNETGSDGIGDTPYVIDEQNQDSYPLMQPYQGSIRNLNTGQSYSTVQEAIDNAHEGDALLVLSGIYYEDLTIDKPLMLIGEDPNATVIYGSGNREVVIFCASNVSLTSFTIRGRGGLWGGWTGIRILDGLSNIWIHDNIIIYHGAGIELDGNTSQIYIYKNNVSKCLFGIRMDGAANIRIYDNIITQNKYGIDLSGSTHIILINNSLTSHRVGMLMPLDGYAIRLFRSNYNVVYNNFISDNWEGVFLWDSLNNTIENNNITDNLGSGIVLSRSNNTLIKNNNIVDNGYVQVPPYPGLIYGAGIEIRESTNNKIWHNNFIQNTPQVDSDNSSNIWNNGYPSGGNYWSNYIGTDLFSGLYQNETGCDGIGDTSYVINRNNQDNYPLMGPFNTFDVGVWNEVAYNVDIISSSRVSNFKIDLSEKTISFNVTGVEGTAGFCRITIPNIIVQDLWQGNYTVLLNGEPWPFRNWTDTTSTYIYINYTHSEHQIVIIPQFPSSIALLEFLMLITIPLIFTKKRQQTRKTNERT